MMERLNFTTAVLGQKAASRLRERQVTQTIRSGSSSIVLAISDQRVKSGELIQVTLDDEFVGYAKATSMDKVRLDDLTQDDARRGGFDNRFELFYALRRAGYRFKPLNEYVFYRCQFTWEVVENDLSRRDQIRQLLGMHLRSQTGGRQGLQVERNLSLLSEANS